MQRVRMSLPYYRQNGWDPVVLAVDPVTHGGPREEPLVATVPSDVPIHFCGAWPLARSRRFGIGNLGLRAWLPLFRLGASLIRREKIDLVVFSSSQFITFTLGPLWRSWLGVPYVIDLQDPWRRDHVAGTPPPGAPGGWKYRVACLQARLLEPWVFRRMSALMTVSPAYLDILHARYPWFRHIPSSAIRFGASRTDLTAAEALPETPRPAAEAGKKPLIRFVYTGVAIVPAAVELLFEAFRRYCDRCPHEADRIRFEFLGTSYAPRDRATPSILPIAERFGVERHVHEVTDRLGHLEAMKVQAGADALLLIGSPDPAYSPSKLYPYYLSGRPILAVVYSGSMLEQHLRELSCAELVAFDPTKSNETPCAQLGAFFAAAADGFPSTCLPRRNDALFHEEYLAESLTARQCALFDRVFEST